MPSPLGHALGGLAAGWLVAGRPDPERRAGTRLAVTFAVLAMAPDLDLLTSAHRGVTHSIGAAVLTAAVVWGFLVLRGRPATRLALACGAAWASHVLLDWLGTDTSAPVGLMALWPLSDAFYQAPVHVFLSVSRRIHHPEQFWIPNLLALLREVGILLPAVLLAYRAARRPAHQTSQVR